MCFMCVNCFYKIWDIKERPFQCIRTITGNYGSIYSLAVAKDHHRLLSGTYENKINVYFVFFIC